VSWSAARVAKLLGVGSPIVQAPMAGATTPALVAAVSNAGALGAFGAAWTEPDELRATIGRIRELTDRPFAINLFLWRPLGDSKANAAAMLGALAPLYAELGLPLPEVCAPFDPPALLEAQLLAVVAEERVPVFSFTFGIPPLEEIRESGAVIGGTATTIAEAVALEEAGVDFVVAQGSEAGGHRGTFLHPFADAMIGGLALLPQIVDRVSVPVVSAGAIMDGRDIVAALALGAEGVQLGTAFLACHESAASELHKSLLAETGDIGTAVSAMFTGRPARAIRTRLGEELERISMDALPFPVQTSVVSPVSSAALEQGRPELGFLLAGQAAALSRRLGAAELVATLVAETERRFAGSASSQANGAGPRHLEPCVPAYQGDLALLVMFAAGHTVECVRARSTTSLLATASRLLRRSKTRRALARRRCASGGATEPRSSRMTPRSRRTAADAAWDDVLRTGPEALGETQGSCKKGMQRG
jgi:nitronate monooxygenase